MLLKAVKWGNSLAIRLPISITKKLQLNGGDKVNIAVNDLNEIVISPSKNFDKAALYVI